MWGWVNPGAGFLDVSNYSGSEDKYTLLKYYRSVEGEQRFELLSHGNQQKVCEDFIRSWDFPPVNIESVRDTVRSTVKKYKQHNMISLSPCIFKHLCGRI